MSTWLSRVTHIGVYHPAFPHWFGSLYRYIEIHNNTYFTIESGTLPCICTTQFNFNTTRNLQRMTMIVQNSLRIKEASLYLELCFCSDKNGLHQNPIVLMEKEWYWTSWRTKGWNLRHRIVSVFIARSSGSIVTINALHLPPQLSPNTPHYLAPRHTNHLRTPWNRTLLRSLPHLHQQVNCWSCDNWLAAIFQLTYLRCNWRMVNCLKPPCMDAMRRRVHHHHRCMGETHWHSIHLDLVLIEVSWPSLGSYDDVQKIGIPHLIM